MSTEEYIALVYKNLQGEITPAEFRLLNESTVSNDDWATQRYQLEAIWDATSDMPQIVTPQETSTLTDRILNQQKAPAKVFSLKKWMSSIAAVAILAIAVVGLMRNSVEIYDEAGQYTLSDGSTIDVREGSQLEVVALSDTARQVKLMGEVYFDIAKDAGRPFTIDTDRSRVTVLGTSFLIKEKATSTYVDVKEGVVKFESLTSDAGIVLTAGMIAEHNASNKIEAIDNYKNLAGWKDGYYSYRDQTLSVVLEELGMIHDTEITTTDPVLYDCTLSATLTGANISDVLSQIARQYNMEVEQHGDKWTLVGGTCK